MPFMIDYLKHSFLIGFNHWAEGTSYAELLSYIVIMVCYYKKNTSVKVHAYGIPRTLSHTQFF